MKKIKRYSTTPSFGPFPGLPWLCYFHCPVLEECPISHNKFHFPLPVKFPTSLWTQVQMETGCKATWSGFCHWVLLWLAKWLLQRQYPKVETAYPYRAKVKTQNWRLFWRFNANIYFFVCVFIFGCTVIVFHEINMYWYSCGDTFCDSNIKNMWFREQRLDSADFV